MAQHGQAVHSDYDEQLRDLNKRGSSTNEKLLVADLRFNTGETIKITSKTGETQFLYKLGSRQYVDLVTKIPVSDKEVAHYLVEPGLSSKATATDIHSSPSVSKAISSYHDRNRVVLDFETAYTPQRKIPTSIDKSAIFTTGIADITSPVGAQQTLRGREYYAADVFDSMLSSSEEVSQRAYGNFASMNENTRAGYYKTITGFAKSKGIDLTGINNIDDFVANKERMAKVMGELQGLAKVDVDTDSLRDYSKMAAEMGVSRTDIQAGLGRASDIAKEMQSVFGIGLHKSPTILAYNPTGVDIPVLKTMFGDDLVGKLSIKDIRGQQLFINSALMPNLSTHAMETLSPVMDSMLHRLNATDSQRKNITANLRNGLSGIFAGNTAAEDFETHLRYALGYDKNITPRPTAHGAQWDAFRELRLAQFQTEFVEKSAASAINQNARMTTPQAKYMASAMVHATATTLADDMPFINKQSVGWMGEAVDNITKRINVNELERRIQNNLERSLSYRAEKSWLGSGMAELGGRTIAQLLGGAMLFAGVRGAVQSIQERMMNHRYKDMEGLSHESLFTTVRRLSMSDFGSGYLGLASSTLKVIKTMFHQYATNPDGLGAATKKMLTDIGGMIKESGAIKLFKEKLSLSKIEKIGKYKDKIFGLSKSGIGTIPQYIMDLEKRGTITSGLANTLLKHFVAPIDNITGSYIQSAITKISSLGASSSASKTIKQRITGFISHNIMGPDKKLKGPAVALGLGGIGALGIMMSRGKYDVEEMNKPLPGPLDNKYRHIDEHQQSVRGMIRDIRNSQSEGIAGGSEARQALRYTHTEFGSGYIKMPMIGTIAEKTRHLVTNVKLAYKGTPKMPIRKSAGPGFTGLPRHNPGKAQKGVLHKIAEQLRGYKTLPVRQNRGNVIPKRPATVATKSSYAQQLIREVQGIKARAGLRNTRRSPNINTSGYRPSSTKLYDAQAYGGKLGGRKPIQEIAASDKIGIMNASKVEKYNNKVLRRMRQVHGSPAHGRATDISPSSNNTIIGRHTSNEVVNPGRATKEYAVRREMGNEVGPVLTRSNMPPLADTQAININQNIIHHPVRLPQTIDVDQSSIPFSGIHTTPSAPKTALALSHRNRMAGPELSSSRTSQQLLLSTEKLQNIMNKYNFPRDVKHGSMSLPYIPI